MASDSSREGDAPPALRPPSFRDLTFVRKTGNPIAPESMLKDVGGFNFHDKNVFQQESKTREHQDNLMNRINKQPVVAKVQDSAFGRDLNENLVASQNRFMNVHWRFADQDDDYNLFLPHHSPGATLLWVSLATSYSYYRMFSKGGYAHYNSASRQAAQDAGFSFGKFVDAPLENSRSLRFVESFFRTHSKKGVNYSASNEIAHDVKGELADDAQKKVNEQTVKTLIREKQIEIDSHREIRRRGDGLSLISETTAEERNRENPNSNTSRLQNYGWKNYKRQFHRAGRFLFGSGELYRDSRFITKFGHSLTIGIAITAIGGFFAWSVNKCWRDMSTGTYRGQLNRGANNEEISGQSTNIDFSEDGFSPVALHKPGRGSISKDDYEFLMWKLSTGRLQAGHALQNAPETSRYLYVPEESEKLTTEVSDS